MIGDRNPHPRVFCTDDKLGNADCGILKNEYEYAYPPAYIPSPYRGKVRGPHAYLLTGGACHTDSVGSTRLYAEREKNWYWVDTHTGMAIVRHLMDYF